MSQECMNYNYNYNYNHEFNFKKSFSSVILHVVDIDSKIMLYDSIESFNLIIDLKIICCE